MADETQRNGAGEEGRKYTIIRVGLPGVVEHLSDLSETENTVTRVAEMIHHFVPDVQVLSCTIFGDKIESCPKETEMSEEQGPIREQWTHVSVHSSHSPRSEGARSDAPVTPKLNEGDIEDTASAITVALDPLWLLLIEEEALALLNLIGSKVDRGRILLVGYGFGGIVIKRAIVLANTPSQYYGIAFQVDRLVFFSTPNRDGEKKEWERVIKDRMQITDAKPPSRLPEILFWLFRSSSQISQDFHKFAAEYPMTNFIEKSDDLATKPIMDEGELTDNMDDVDSGPEKEPQNLTLHEIATLDHLETLRTLFGLNQTCSNGLASSQHDYGAICDYKYLLHRAALDNKLEAFMALRNLLENISEADDEGMTPLHMAAAGGSTSIISHLLGKCTIEHELINIEAVSLLDKPDHKQRTPLIMAASMGHEEATKLLLQYGANISTQDDTGKTVLHYGALKCLIAVEDFISSDLLSVRDKDGRTALHIAASSGNSSMASIIVDVLKREFRLKKEINRRDGTGKTPLQYAADQGHTAIVEKFLSHQGCVEKENYSSAAELAAASGHLSTVRLLMSGSKECIGIQVLLAASEAGSVEIVRYLSMEKRVPSSMLWNGRLPICQATAGGHLEVVCTLSRFRYSVVKVDHRERTALHYAADCGNLAISEVLIPKAELNARDNRGETPLHIAARNGKTSVVRLLLECHARKNLHSSEGKTPLHLAVAHPMAIEALLKAGADPNLVDKESQTPLQQATRGGFWQSVRYLLNYKANARTLDDEKKPPIYYAITNDHLLTVQEFFQHDETLVDISTQITWAINSTASTVFEYFISVAQTTMDDFDSLKANLFYNTMVEESVQNLDFLLRSGLDANFRRQGSSALHLAAQNGCVYHLQRLIDFKANVNARDDKNRTPLHLAAQNNEYETIKVLLDGGSDINAQDNDLVTPIYLAAESNSRDALEVLLQYQHTIVVDIATLSQGWTPLHLCSQKRASGTAKMLLIAGANPNLASLEGHTPLHIAALNHKTRMVNTLLDYGGSPTLTTKKGDTVLHLAIRRYGVEITEALLNHGAEKCINDRGETNDTAFHLALLRTDCDVEMLQLLIDHGADIDLRSGEELSTLELAVNTLDVEKLDLLLRTEIKSRADPKWQFDDLIRAYEKAITLYCHYDARKQAKEASKCTDMVKVLLQKEPKLQGRESGAESGTEANMRIRHEDRK